MPLVASLTKINEMNLLLHVWGSLGSATLALLQQCTSTTLLRFLSYATILDGLRFIVVQQCNQQHCYARNNKTHVSMVFGILLTSSVCWNLLERRRVLKSRESSVCWRSFEYRRACVSEDWVRIGKLREEHVSLYRGRWRQSIVGASAG
jgi:hypothetical protein